MKTGYKEMLRDRVPYVVDLALKWCKSKQLWIDHVYNTSIRPYCSKEDRNMATRTILGLAKVRRNFNFHETIDWDNLSEEETEAWKNVEEWVTWFEKCEYIIENDVKNTYSTEYNYVYPIVSKDIKTLTGQEDYKLAKFLTKELLGL